MQRGDGWMSKRGFISVHEFNLSIQCIFLSGQQYALRTAEFSVYETISNTNTPVSRCRLTTVLDLCVSWTPWLSYTSEEKHLLWQRPPSRDADFLSCRRCLGSVRCSEGLPRWLHLRSSITPLHWRSVQTAAGRQDKMQVCKRWPWENIHIKRGGLHHSPRLNTIVFATFELCFQHFKTVYSEKHYDVPHLVSFLPHLTKQRKRLEPLRGFIFSNHF